jgi:hypothetical protein
VASVVRYVDAALVPGELLPGGGEIRQWQIWRKSRLLLSKWYNRCNSHSANVADGNADELNFIHQLADLPVVDVSEYIAPTDQLTDLATLIV